jgi:hypothetical protein
VSWHLQLDFGADEDWLTYVCGDCGAYQQVRDDWAERTELRAGDGGEPVQCLQCGQSAQLPEYARADA